MYAYCFEEYGGRGDGYFPSVEEALKNARKNANGDKTVYIGHKEVREFRVDGDAVLEQIDRDVDADVDDDNFSLSLHTPQADVDDLSEMLTQTFRAWADKHGYDKAVEYIGGCKEYDLATGRQV